MTITYDTSVPVTAQADVDIDILDVSDLIHLDTVDTTASGGAKTRTTTYACAAGDKELSFGITVRRTQRPITDKEPYGSSSYSVRFDFDTRMVNGSDALLVFPGNATISWNIQGTTIYEEAEVAKVLQALFSVLWDSYVDGVPQVANLTGLAYGNTRILG